jgi:hypothetical protein
MSNAEVMRKTHESGCGLRRKYGVAEKSGKAHLSAQLIFLPSFPWLRTVHRSQSQSNSIKVNQSDFVGQASGQNRMETHDNEQLAK